MCDFEGDGFDARAVAFLAVGDHYAHLVALGPAQIHAQQHLRPILALGAAGPGMHGDNGALGVVLAGEEHLGFQLLQQFRVGLQLLRDLRFHLLPFAGELEQSI